MKITLVPLKPENLEMFKRDMQEAFQYGYEMECVASDEGDYFFRFEKNMHI